jgi:predicted MFS family arabinose efflux permease
MVSVRLPERIGTSHTILFGMTILVASQLLFLSVRSAWQLAIPGIATGAAHALLFPSIVASGSGPFPARYRGLGTTLILGTFDVGNLIGMPLAGSIVHAAQSAGWEPYATMFLSMAAIIATASFYFWLGVRSPVRASD